MSQPYYYFQGQAPLCENNDHSNDPKNEQCLLCKIEKQDQCIMGQQNTIGRLSREKEELLAWANPTRHSVDGLVLQNSDLHKTIDSRNRTIETLQNLLAETQDKLHHALQGK